MTLNLNLSDGSSGPMTLQGDNIVDYCRKCSSICHLHFH